MMRQISYMVNYIRIAGTCCDLVNDGTHASIKTWGPIANRSSVSRVIERSGYSSELDAMMDDMEKMILIWRDSYGEYGEAE